MSDYPLNSEKLSASDIQIFIFTYDRPEWLRLSLESVLAQTVKGLSITVLDNGTNPATERVAANYSQSGVNYYSTRHLGHLGNTLQAQTIAEGKYVLLFHDDDQLHPEYIHNVATVINTYPDVNLLTGRMTLQPAGVRKSFTESLEPIGYLFDQKMFATFRYNSGACYFPITVYRTALFKQLDIPQLYHCYGKWRDNPMIVQMVQDGKAFVFIQSCGWYGIHQGQDCVDQNTLPEFNAWLNMEKSFLAYLGDDPATFSGLSFCILNYRHLASGYKRRMKKTVGRADYFNAALENGSMTPRSYRFHYFTNGLVQKLFRMISRYYFSRHIRTCPKFSESVI